MTDLILTLGQDQVRDDILQFRLLAKSGAPPQLLREIWLSILAYIEDEKERYPPELDPATFFDGKTVFGRRGTRPIVRLYLYKVHQYLENVSKKNLPR